jgi:hypothetical protein
LALIIPAHAGVAAASLAQPSWAELNPQQRQILAPLAGEWDQLESYRRKKWVGIAQRYPTMTPEEQARIRQQMTTWVHLSPEERKLARERYRTLKKAPPEKQAATRQKWEEYKELPPEEKRLLKEQAARTLPKKAAQKSVKATAVPKPPIIPPPEAGKSSLLN